MGMPMRCCVLPLDSDKSDGATLGAFKQEKQMSFDRLSLAIANVEINKISDIQLVKLIREAMNKDVDANHRDYVTLVSAMCIAKALKKAESQGYVRAINFVAEG